MDPVTTGLGGALIAKALSEKQRGPIGVWVLTGAALFPDIDILSPVLTGDPLAILTIHRGFTHSFAGVLVLAPLLALLARLTGRDRNFRRLLGLCALALVWHIFTDLPTTWGTIVFFPFSWRRVAWDWVFIIDLYYTGLLLLPQLLAWIYLRRERPGTRGTALRIFALWLPLTALMHAILNYGSEALGERLPFTVYLATGMALAAVLSAPWMGGWGFRLRRETFTRAGLMAFAAYVALTAVSHSVALRQVEVLAARNGLGMEDIERIAALPQPLSPFRWAGMVLTAEGVHTNRFNVFGESPPEFVLHPSDINEFVRRAREVPAAKTYLWFARFPVAHYRSSGDRHIVEFAAMRFSRPGPVDEETRVRFGFRVVFDGEGKLLSAGFPARE